MTHRLDLPVMLKSGTPAISASVAFYDKSGTLLSTVTPTFATALLNTSSFVTLTAFLTPPAGSRQAKVTVSNTATSSSTYGAAWIDEVRFRRAIDSEALNAAAFGVTGDGSDQTAAMTACFNAAIILGRKIELPAGTIGVSAALPTLNFVGAAIVGKGQYNTTIKALASLGSSPNYGALIIFGGSALYCNVSDLNIDCTGYATRAVYVTTNCTVLRFDRMVFTGGQADAQVYSNGQNVDWSQCTFNTELRSVYSIIIDSYNQNDGVCDCRFGGVGSGVWINNTLTAGTGSGRPEGFHITGSYFVCTGPYNIRVGNSLLTLITGNVCDQATLASIQLENGCDGVVINGNWIACRSPLDGTATLSGNGTTTTFTMSQPHYMTTGQAILVAGLSPAGWNGVQSVTVTGANTFTITPATAPGTTASGTAAITRPGTGVSMAATAGTGTTIGDNYFNGNSSCIQVGASSSTRIGNLKITGNHFTGAFGCTIVMDSVPTCQITGNMDVGTPANSSWSTLGTYAGGNYHFANNNWYNSGAVSFHANSNYQFRGDTGIVGDCKGQFAITSATTVAAIGHNLFTTPTTVNANLEGLTDGVGISNRGATTFQANWNTSGKPIIHWQACVGA